MNYKQADKVLPKNLIEEIQKYVKGELLYIPVGKEKKSWGSVSGTRRLIENRNRVIYGDFKNGESIESLSKKNHLSLESIKKIVYNKKCAN